MPRMIWLATGVAWAVSSLIQLVGSSVASLGLVAALAYSVAWLLFAPSLVLVSRLAEARRAHILGTAIAVTAVVAAIANLVVNVLGVSGVSEWYGSAILLATAMLVPFAYLFARERLLRLAALSLGLFLGIGFVAPAIGGLIVLLVFGALGLRTEWFEARSDATSPQEA